MVVATGFFDGVHTGHRLVIEQLVKAAENNGDESMVVTFWPHPRNVLQLEARTLRLLNSLPEKEAILKSLGVDHVEVIRFTKEFGALTTGQYLKEFLIDRYGARTIVLGYDNRMGCDAADAASVAETARSLGLEVITAPKVTSSGIDVSSTKIRARIAEGDVAGASVMLGYDYSLFGVVVSGERIGRNVLGFPTANMQLYEPLKLVPANGVYFVKVGTLGKSFYGMCNIGTRPTMDNGSKQSIEVHIFDFDDNIYGQRITVEFVKFLRTETKMNSIEELKQQLEEDRIRSKQILGM